MKDELENKCGYHSISRNIRAMPEEVSHEATKRYKDIGCFGCDGEKDKKDECPLYYNPQGEYTKGLETFRGIKNEPTS